MEQEFTQSGAWMLLALLSNAGFFGLRMCRAMLRSTTAFDLRQEAASASELRENLVAESGFFVPAIDWSRTSRGGAVSRGVPRPAPEPHALPT